MAGNLTRINNNQITDAVSGNAQLGIDASTKLQNYSITSGKLANDITYGSNLTITGNLAVQGNTTTIDTTTVTIEDPILLLASNQAGTPAVDIGYIGQRGTYDNIAFVWEEANTAFMTVYTDSTAGADTVNILGYANLITGNATVTGNLTAANVSFTGNIEAANISVTGLVSAANVSVSSLSNTQVVFAGPNGELLGNIDLTYVPGDVINRGLISTASNIQSGSLTVTGNISATNEISASANISTTGNVLGDGLFTANGNLAGQGTIVLSGGGGNPLTGDSGFTFNAGGSGNLYVTGNATVTGNLTAGNINANITSTVANTEVVFAGPGGELIGNAAFTFDSATSNLSVIGNTTTTGIASVTGNVFAGNVFVPAGEVSVVGSTTSSDLYANNSGGGTGAVSATGNITGANFLTAGVVSATGNVDAGNVMTAGVVSAVGNVTGGNISTLGNVVGSENVQGGNVLTNNLLASGSLTVSAVGGISLDPNGVGNGNINVNSAHINNVQLPVQAADAANKEYVDAIAQGLDLKASVDVATTGPLANETEVTSVVYYNGPANDGVAATLTITTTSQLLFDGVDLSTLGTGETARVLVKNEEDPATGTSDAAWNGIYFIVSSSALSTVLQRSVDFDNEGALGNIPGSFVFDIGGGTQNGTGWVCITANPIVMGTTPIIWTQFSGAGTYTGGNAIAINGTVITTLYNGTQIGVNGSNQLYIPANAPLITPDIGNATGNSINLVNGNINLGNLIANAEVLATGNVSSTGNVTGGNLISGLDVLASSGNVYGNNVNAVSSINSAGTIYALSGINSDAYISAVGNVIGGNINTANAVSATGNIYSGAEISATGNVTAANFTTTGSAGNITGANVIQAVTLSATGNIFSDGNISAVGNVLGAYLWGDGSNITGLSTSASNIANGTSNVEIYTANGNVTFGVAGTNNVLVVSDTYTTASGNLSAVGNVLGNNVSANTVTGATQGTFGNVTIIGPAIESNAGQLVINGALATNDFAVNGSTANLLFVNGTTNTVSVGSNVQTTGATFAINATDSVLLPSGNTAQRPATPTTGMFRWNNQEGFLEVWDGSQWQDVGATQYTVISNEQFNGDGVTTTFTLAQTLTTDACLVSINGVVQAPTTAYAVTGTSLVFTEAPQAGDIIEVRELTTTTSVGSINNGNLSLSAVQQPGNVVLTGGNLVVAAGGYLYGDGTYLTNVGGGNVIATKIVNGTSQANFAGANGDFYVAVGGGNVLDVGTGTTTITGNFNPSANVTYSLGNATNRWSTLYVAGNTIYLGDGTLTSNASGITLTNSDGGSFTVSGTQAGAGNITGGNVAVSGAVSAVGNITGSFIKGNATYLTGLPVSYTNSNVADYLASGTVTTTIETTGNISGGNVYSGGLMSAGVGNVATLNVSTSANIKSATFGTATQASINTDGNIATSGTVSATGNVSGAAFFTAGIISATGNITGSELNIGSIVNTNANGSGNIGSSSGYFDTIFAKATSAQYADLAEKYTADAEYAPGTVVSFGGSAEVTASTADGDRRVAGVVSTNPSYIMNGGLDGANVVTVALTGRVPCRVTGTVRKGDLMVSNGDGTARADADPKAGSIIGKALADFDGAEGTIEVVVGRF